MTTTTAVGRVLDALVTVLRPAIAPATLYDGPPVTTVTDRAYIVVGADDPGGDANAAEMQQRITSLGAVSRGEAIDIRCVATATRPTVPEARAAALSLVDKVDPALAADRSLGLPDVYGALLSAVSSLRQVITQDGPAVIIYFTISAQARLL